LFQLVTTAAHCYTCSACILFTLYTGSPCDDLALGLQTVSCVGVVMVTWHL